MGIEYAKTIVKNKRLVIEPNNNSKRKINGSCSYQSIKSGTSGSDNPYAANHNEMQAPPPALPLPQKNVN